jgi:hypothetical protein
MDTPKTHSVIARTAENAPPRRHVSSASGYDLLAAEVTRTLADADTHMLMYPANAEQAAPIMNDIVASSPVQK